MVRTTRLAVLLALSAVAAMSAYAQSWPSRTVRFVLPTPAGSSVDIVARVVSDKLDGICGQSVIVDNKPGAGGTIGVDADVADVDSRDRYTFLLGYNGPLAVAPSLSPKPHCTVSRDLAPIALAMSKPGVLDYASIGIGSLSTCPWSCSP